MALRALAAGLILLLALASPAGAVVPELRSPKWSELSAEQQRILAPLQASWEEMDFARKKKWLGIAARYPSMKPEEQARMQQRMRDWAALTPKQRSQARKQYKNLKAAPPEKKQAIREKWEQYEELPEEEKARLSKKAAKPKPPAAFIQLDPPPPPPLVPPER